MDSTRDPRSAPKIWINPPDTPLPITKSSVRISIGSPPGRSTNSWKIWVYKNDAYVACRDNFREFKVSLHASGVWRLGFTEIFAKSRPGFIPEGKDRAWRKWTPILDDKNRLALAFQILAPRPTLYLQSKDRKKWPNTIVFIEPPFDENKMTVVSVAVVLGTRPVTFAAGTVGGVIGILPFGENRTIQIIASEEIAGGTLDEIKKALHTTAIKCGGPAFLPKFGILFVHGVRDDGTPWVSAARFENKRHKKAARAPKRFGNLANFKKLLQSQFYALQRVISKLWR